MKANSFSHRLLRALQRCFLGGSDGVGVQSQTTDQRHTQDAPVDPHPQIGKSSLRLPLWFCTGNLPSITSQPPFCPLPSGASGFYGAALPSDPSWLCRLSLRSLGGAFEARPHQSAGERRLPFLPGRPQVRRPV